MAFAIGISALIITARGETRDFRAGFAHFKFKFQSWNPDWPHFSQTTLQHFFYCSRIRIKCQIFQRSSYKQSNSVNPWLDSAVFVSFADYVLNFDGIQRVICIQPNMLINLDRLYFCCHWFVALAFVLIWYYYCLCWISLRINWPNWDAINKWIMAISVEFQSFLESALIETYSFVVSFNYYSIFNWLKSILVQALHFLCIITSDWLKKSL